MKSFLLLVKPYFNSEHKLYARWMGVLLIVLSQALVGFSYFYAWWNKRFFDVLESRDINIFFKECLIFCIAGIFYSITYSLSQYYGQQYALKWRIWMTNRALNLWVNNTKRALLEGSDQRIQDDLMRFTVIIERFFLECFNAIVIICCFTPILFNLTRNLIIANVQVSTLLLVSAAVYTGIGMYSALKMTSPLIKLEYDNQKYEAAFRYNLVHAKDGKTVTTMAFLRLLSPIFRNYRAKYHKQRQFNLFLKMYTQFSFLIPFVILAPSYFAGILSLGTLVQIRLIFANIRRSMAYLLDHYTEFTELQAISTRLLEFYNSLDQITEPTKVSATRTITIESIA